MNNKRIVKIYTHVSTTTQFNTTRDAVLSCSSAFCVFELPLFASDVEIEAAARVNCKIDANDDIVVVDLDVD